MNRIRVAVIGGGQNCEHTVSLASAASVCAALDPARYDVVPLTITEDGRWLCNGAVADSMAGPVVDSVALNTMADSLADALTVLSSCGVVLPIVHGPKGEDGALAGLLDLAGLPYVGCGVRAGALAMDKWATKLVANAIGIATAPGVVVSHADAARAAATVPTPLIVKPIAAGSSHGVTRVDNPADLDAALQTALALDDRALVEELVVGREIDIAVLERADGSRLISPPLEIVVDDGQFFDTDHKYGGGADFRLPAEVTDVATKQLESAALALFDALGCAGVVRFDFFLTDAGLVLNEVNTMPGMTEQSQVPKMFAAMGLPYSRLLDELVNGALRCA